MLLNECVVTKEKFYILKGKKILCNCSKIDGYLKDYGISFSCAHVK